MTRAKIATYGVSLLGSLGVATAALYFASVGLSFVSGFSWVSELMVGDRDNMAWGFLWVVIPYLLIVAHFYLRTHLGSWLVKQGEFDEAIKFSSKRTGHSALRSRSEALAHRIALSEAWLAKVETDSAIDALGEEKPKLRNHFFWQWAGQRAEALFRADRTEELQQHFENVGPPHSRRAAMYAAVGAQFFHETEDREQMNTFLEHAKWADKSHLRLKLSQASIRSDEPEPDVLKRALVEIPGRTGEFAHSLNEPDLSLSDARSERIHRKQHE